jgi:hypothetical protein
MPRDDQLKRNADRRALFVVMDEQAILYWPNDPKFSDPKYVEAELRRLTDEADVPCRDKPGNTGTGRPSR